MVRLAREEELDQVNRLRAQVAALHSQNRPDIYPPGFGPERAAEALELLRRPDADLIVAMQGQVAAGYACVIYKETPASAHSAARRVCHIEEFGVDEACRRQKIGQQLFAFIKARAAEQGFRQIQLNVWAFNRQALAFYQAMGFQPLRYSLEYRAE